MANRKPLRIAVDIRDLNIAKTGTLTYLEELCKEFRALQSPDLRFFFLDGLPVLRTNTRLSRLRNHLRYQLWKQIVLPAKAYANKCNVVFCTDNFVPLIHLGYKTVTVFHDAFFFENPEHYSKAWLSVFYKLGLPAAKRAAAVIVPTYYVKERVDYFTHIAEEKLKVVYEGPKLMPDLFDDGKSKEFLEKYGLLKGKFILHIGSVYKRKNIPALVRAFEAVKQNGHAELKLVLAGPTPDNPFGNQDFNELMTAINAASFKDDIILTGYLTNEQVAVLYSNALLYVFPSVNEGFGIPVLEAFRFNLPVLVADNSCLPEVGGNAVLTFHPYLPGDLEKILNILLTDNYLRGQLVKKGVERLKLFSWKNAATQLVEIFRSVI